MKIQLSLSTKCNLHCRFCLKEVLFEKYGFVENIDMDLDIAKKIFDHDIEKIHICSNRGEALFHDKIDDIIMYAKEKGNKIDFVTHAFHKPRIWWVGLAKLFTIEDCVIFPLDGVGNKTHNIYRMSDFYTVLRNIEAFVNAGGNAIWRFIKFKHNQHQVELAEQLAENIGCRLIVINSHTYDSKLEKPDTKVWTTENILDEEITSKDFIPCDDKQHYVNVKGILFPCCFIANVFGNKPLRDRHYEKDLVKLFEEEKELLKIENNDINYIIENSKFFKELISNKNSFVCKQVCLKWSRNTKNDTCTTLL